MLSLVLSFSIFTECISFLCYIKFRSFSTASLMWKHLSSLKFFLQRVLIKFLKLFNTFIYIILFLLYNEGFSVNRFNNLLLLTTF